MEEIISDNSKFEKLHYNLETRSFTTMFFTLVEAKKKNFFNEIKYDKLYPSGSAPARICGTPKMHKFSFSVVIHFVRLFHL